MQFKVVNVANPPSGKQPDSGENARMERGKAVTMNLERAYQSTQIKRKQRYVNFNMVKCTSTK